MTPSFTPRSTRHTAHVTSSLGWRQETQLHTPRTILMSVCTPTCPTPHSIPHRSHWNRRLSSFSNENVGVHPGSLTFPRTPRITHHRPLDVEPQSSSPLTQATVLSQVTLEWVCPLPLLSPCPSRNINGSSHSSAPGPLCPRVPPRSPATACAVCLWGPHGSTGELAGPHAFHHTDTWHLPSLRPHDRPWLVTCFLLIVGYTQIGGARLHPPVEKRYSHSALASCLL